MSVPFDQQRTQSGNSIFEDVYVYGIAEFNNIILTSPNGTKYKLVVSNDGTLSTEPVP